MQLVTAYPIGLACPCGTTPLAATWAAAGVYQGMPPGSSRLPCHIILWLRKISLAPSLSALLFCSSSSFPPSLLLLFVENAINFPSCCSSSKSPAENSSSLLRLFVASPAEFSRNAALRRIIFCCCSEPKSSNFARRLHFLPPVALPRVASCCFSHRLHFPPRICARLALQSAPSQTACTGSKGAQVSFVFFFSFCLFSIFWFSLLHILNPRRNCLQVQPVEMLQV